MAAVLAGRAESIGAKYIALGVHQGDHHIYPDCRTSYIKLLDSLIYNASEEKIEVLTPVLGGDKVDILRTGFAIGVPYELTRTCYKDQQISCGKCGSCQERIEAFQAHKVKDPIPYEIAIVWESDINEPTKG
jgi:7-cyano-7-deazaguanine synthase